MAVAKGVIRLEMRQKNIVITINIHICAGTAKHGI